MYMKNAMETSKGPFIVAFFPIEFGDMNVFYWKHEYFFNNILSAQHFETERKPVFIYFTYKSIGNVVYRQMSASDKC